MAESDFEPTEAQRAALEHGAGPALLLGAAGTGKSEVLARRVARRDDPEEALVLARSPGGASAISARVEDLTGGRHGDLWIGTYRSLGEALLREHFAEAGLDPFFEVIGSPQRLAIMLEHLDELPLRRHEIRGNPAGLLAVLLQRIDVLKAEAISPGALRGWASERHREAGDVAAREWARREVEFAELYAQHDRLLRAAGALDAGDAVLELARVVRERPDVGERLARRFPLLVADELEDCGIAHRALLSRLEESGSQLLCACDDDQAVRRHRGAGIAALAWFRARHPEAPEFRLERCFNGGADLAAAAAAVAAGIGGRERKPSSGAGEPGAVRFWACANERAQAQASAREIEHLLSAGETSAERICVIVGDAVREGRVAEAALEERSIPFRHPGPSAFFQRPEVRDVIAWLRMLADPTDTAAVVRALTRPPTELRSVDLASCTKIARRRKLDMISALEAALESPQLPPEARDRIRPFLALHRAASGALDDMRADVFVSRLVERIGIRRHQLFAAHPETARRLANLAALGEIAAGWTRREPRGSTRAFIRYLSAVADAGDLGVEDAEPTGEDGHARGAVVIAEPAQVKGRQFDHVFVLGLSRGAFAAPAGRENWAPADLVAEELPAAGPELAASARARLAYVAITRARRSVVLARPLADAGGELQPAAVYEAARAALGAAEETHAEELFGPEEGLHSTYRMIRDEVLEASWRAGSALSEMRLDTAEDLNRAVTRFLELVKLAALVQRPPGEGALDSLSAVNDLIGRIATPEQRAALEASALDAYLVGDETERASRREQLASREEPSLEAFIPRSGEGLALSASDIGLYRTCPLKYKFARVFAIPQEPTINQRFGILIHNVLERFHAEERLGPVPPIERLLALFEAGWRRSGFGASDDELQYRDRAVAALTRYHQRHVEEAQRPVWLERGFSFKVGPHQVRGRVDRVDELAGGGLELIDYKTGPRATQEAISGDLQLAIYTLGAREAWNVEADQGAYYYVLEDEKVTVPAAPDDTERVERTVLEVGEQIRAQDFEPRPSYEICSWCDFRLICPASEA